MCIRDRNNIETKVFSLEEKEIPSSVVGELVMDELKDLDEVAYVRFASVYLSLIHIWISTIWTFHILSRSFS